jgi:hypothetical protein
MNSTTGSSQRWVRAISCVVLFLLVGAVAARADVIFEEDFNGYGTNPNFPSWSNDLGGHRTIFGVPSQSAGADSDLWLAARFELADSDPITSDVGVLRYGSGGPWGAYGNPAGRVDDDAGLVFKLDLTHYADVELALDWRTYATESSDRLVVAYYRGDGLGTPGNLYDWFNDPALGAGDMSASDPTGQANTWYVNNWVEVLRGTSPGGFQQASGISIPGGSVTYVAFWLDNGDHDLGKIDNIVVTGTLMHAPEPSSVALAAIGLAALWFARVRRRGQT